MKQIKFLLSLCVVIGFMGVQSAQAIFTVVDFDTGTPGTPVPPVYTDPDVLPLTGGGFTSPRVESGGSGTFENPLVVPAPGLPVNGTTYLFDPTGTETFTFRIPEYSLDFISFEFGAPGLAHPITVTVTGVYRDGGPAPAPAIFGSLGGGFFGPPNDMTTHPSGPWVGLASITVSSTGPVALDAFAFEAIATPEAGTSTSLGLLIAMACFVRRMRRKK